MKYAGLVQSNLPLRVGTLWHPPLTPPRPAKSRRWFLECFHLRSLYITLLGPSPFWRAWLPGLGKLAHSQ